MAQVDLKLSKEELESVLLPSIKANFPNLTKIDLIVTEDRQVLVKFDLPIHQVKSLSETFPKEDKILEMRSEGKNVREISKTVGENLKTIKEVLASKPDTRVVERQDFEKMLAAIDSEATKRFQAGEDPNKIAADIAEKHPNERTGAIVDRLHKLFRRLEKDEDKKAI